MATSAAHDRCTGTWAQALHGRRVGGYTTHGLTWHSRQTELHARAMAIRPALRELLDTHPAEVSGVVTVGLRDAADRRRQGSDAATTVRATGTSLTSSPCSASSRSR
ncbi:MAG: hypothetical protein H0V93_07015 [Euzebyales bacterium]|jgi:hypothetical protein|nr:hypothetical protein [Euzebyales bacterium]